jgi:extradiol dioxygenase
VEIQQLGYIGIDSSAPEVFADYTTGVLGLEEVRGEGSRRFFRMDDHHHRLIVESAERDGAAYYGWQLRDSAALAAAADEVADSGTAVTPGTAEDLETRRVAEMVRFRDPAGNRVELYCGPDQGHSFASPRDIPGFLTGDLGLGHVVLMSPGIDEQERFYTEVMGFRVSDFMKKPFEAVFLHTNARHHSIAFADSRSFGITEPALHHFMIEVLDVDQVGHAFDRALDRGVPVTQTLGRHSNDKMFSFYVESPAGINTEFGAGAILVDDDSWEVTEIPGPDLWGHRH